MRSAKKQASFSRNTSKPQPQRTQSGGCVCLASRNARFGGRWQLTTRKRNATPIISGRDREPPPVFGPVNHLKLSRQHLVPFVSYMGPLVGGFLCEVTAGVEKLNGFRQLTK